MSALLLGGYHGAWVPAAEAARLRLDATTMGAGVLAVLPPAAAGSPRPPAWCATWPSSRPASAGRA
ncbi:hypothetical protein ABZT03_07320 [Streptomyces sp. NPDC005574]|uniref:hypothetical protein n=1 Tax=Streptomyces sp. NPDC005574 TaxID=3156891 RepID=UPI0033B91F6F